ncbi:unnamed protein product [Bursaphelenchus xylophilus]|uniref:(pine wood nematode) hypothetical protein n=1 Tax=Bursaphelenchus xylophilus TaxID=6326 RepID=A0A1I7RX25_BURXY|nr:unnamed protein product [Bursaphelenchus xylophilus]CAG9121280.1 unnamed protein product [Bursaphelenchus xylophilus]
MGKRKITYEEEESDTESHENGVEDEEGVDPGASIPPNVIREFCEILDKLQESNVIDHNAKITRLSKLEAVQLNPQVIAYLKKHSLEYSHLMEVYSKYLTKGLSKQRIAVDVGNECVKAYSSSGESVKSHPRFPQAPINQFQKFLSKNNKTIRDVSAAEMQRYRNERQSTLDEESKREYREYVEKLNTFLEQERSVLTEDQVKYVKNTIKKSEKKYKPPHEKSPSKKSKKEKTTRSAFDFFKMAQGAKYQEMDPAKRDLKLRKKFDKLDDAAKEPYLNMEQNQYLD